MLNTPSLLLLAPLIQEKQKAFRSRILSRDKACIITGEAQASCDAAHILERKNEAYEAWVILMLCSLL
jgi:hypothetical protein